ncbi:MAG: hypothetical protein IPK82_28520 [Polyangiaceae bacterium]|nr:hypothetical protein [Polyangiaceae bacterium]
MTWNDDVRAALHNEHLRSRSDLAWLNVPYSLQSGALNQPDLLRAAVGDLTQAFEVAPLAPGAFQGAAPVLLEAPATVRVTLGLLLSAARAPRVEERRERALVAAALFESALGEFTHASIAVRLARLRAELGDERARFAWKEALRRDLTLTWLPPADLRSRPDLTAIESELVAETSGFEGQLRLALQTFRETLSADGVDKLVSEVGGASFQYRQVWWTAVAADRLRKTLLVRSGTPEFVAACHVARGSISRVEDSQVAALLSAQLAIVEKRKADAVGLLTSTGVSSGAASAAVDAIAEVIRKPPHDVAAVLSAAYLMPFLTHSQRLKFRAVFCQGTANCFWARRSAPCCWVRLLYKQLTPTWVHLI